MTEETNVPSPAEDAARVQRAAAEASSELARSAAAMWSEAPERMRALAEAQTRFLNAWMSLAMAPYALMAPRTMENISTPLGTQSDVPH